MNISEWAACCGLLAQLWPRQPLDPQAAEAWFPLLADLDAATVVAAINAHAMGKDAEWPPSIGQIRAAAQPARRPWEEALAELRDAVRRVGAYQSPPTFEDEALQRVVNAYGWERCCWQNSSDPTVRAQFRDAYKAAQDGMLDVERRELAAGSAKRQLDALASRSPAFAAALEARSDA